VNPLRAMSGAMTLRCLYWAAVAALSISCAAVAQESNPAPASPPPSPAPHIFSPFASATPPPVPDDPLELVTGEAQIVQDGQQRAAELALLETAHKLSNVRAQPYDLNTIFTSVDSTGSSTEWALEDISPARDIYRWSAEGPAFSAIFLTKDSLLSSNRPNNAIPLRLAQVRDAIFFEYTWIHAHATVRVATGDLNGAELHCILIAHNQGTRPISGARNWHEFEYCIDPNTGLLATYSPVPGIYYHYHYADALHFHDTIVPAGFTISEGGRTVVEARTLSVTDPVGANSALFSGAGLMPLGTGPSTWGAAVDTISVPPQNMSPRTMNSPLALQIVVVAGIAGSDGHLAESEILTSTSTELNQAAIDQANKTAEMQCTCGPGTAPGAVVPSHEIIYIVRFYSNAT